MLRALQTMSSRVDLWLSEAPAPLKGLSVLAGLPHSVLALLTTVQTGRCRIAYGVIGYGILESDGILVGVNTETPNRVIGSWIGMVRAHWCLLFVHLLNV